MYKILRRKVRLLKRDEKGQFGVVFALLAIPLIGITTLAVDHSFAYKEKLKPFVEQKDPWATYLYAECHCHLSSTSFINTTKGVTDDTDISADTTVSINRLKQKK